MSFTQNRSTIEKYVDEFFNKSHAAIKEQLFAPGFVVHTSMFGLPGTAEGLERAFAVLRDAFLDQHAVIDEVLPVGEDAAVARFTIQGTHVGTFQGFPASGHHVRYSGIAFGRFATDGRMTELWMYHDDVGLLQQIGVLPTPLSAEAAAMSHVMQTWPPM